MHRVAAISDIHGNLPALEAVLADVEREGVDGVIVAGDSVAGPWPGEVFDRLESIGARIVRGNADRLGGEGPFGEWCSERLGGTRLAFVREWPLTLELDVEGLGHVLVCHATPYSDEPIYTPLTPDEAVIEVLGPLEADVVVCGHTHIQVDRSLGNGLRLVNPGSVGLPYEGARGAYWAVFGPDVELRRSEYDVEAAVGAMRELECPVDAGLFNALLNPFDAGMAAVEFEKLRGA